jgi:Leucine-rich repeat (LRR) protein
MNRIQDLNGLTGLSKLQTIDLGQNKILNIKPLCELRAIEVIRLDGNDIRFLPELSKLSNLRLIGLSQNRIEDISALASCTFLGAGDFVDVRQNLIDLSPGSAPMKCILELILRGVDVKYAQGEFW